MSATTVRLLRAASDIVGGKSALAERMAIDVTLLGTYMADRRELPDALLLRAVDIILEDRLLQRPSRLTARTPQEVLRDG